MRRRSPRPLAAALGDVHREAAPATLLARVQACWTDAVGKAIAAEAQPVAERDGTVTVACRSATWASELELLAPEIADRLNGALSAAAGGRVESIRAKVADLS